MAVLSSSYLDLADVYKRQNPDGSMAEIIEMLHEVNPIMMDAYAMECNQGTTHVHTIRTGLPSVAWGRLYKGISQDKSTTAQVTDTTGFVEGLSSVDTRLLDIASNRGALRLQEAQGYLEAMSQEMQEKFFYGSTDSNPDEIKGLSDRFSDTTAGNGSQIVSAGGSGSDNTSVWFVTWGDKYCHLLYPKGTQAGIKRQDMGKQRVLDANGNPYYVEEEMFTQHCGVAVADWRYVARIANIDVSDMQAGSVALYDYMRKAYYKLQSRRVPGGKQCIYMNRDVLEALDALATNAGASDNFVRLQRKEVEGAEVLSYRGIPIRETDALLNTESVVS